MQRNMQRVEKCLCFTHGLVRMCNAVNRPCNDVDCELKKVLAENKRFRDALEKTVQKRDERLKVWETKFYNPGQDHIEARYNYHLSQGLTEAIRCFVSVP